MTTEHTTLSEPATNGTSRRGLVFNSLGMTLSATAVALLAGNPRLSMAASDATADDAANDVRILSTALAAEREAVAAYMRITLPASPPPSSL